MGKAPTNKSIKNYEEDMPKTKKMAKSKQVSAEAETVKSKEDKSISNSVSPHLKKIIIPVIVGVIVGLCCLSVTLIIIMANKPLAEPTLSLKDVEESTKPLNENEPIAVTGTLNTTCELASSLGENLHPVNQNNNNLGLNSSHDDISSEYSEYGVAWCDVLVDGQYTADESLEVNIELSTDDDSYEIIESSDGKLQRFKRYGIYADLAGQPDNATKHVLLTMTGKKKNDKNSPNSVILTYDLAITTSLSESDKNFFVDWRTKIDENIAEEKRKKEEEARLAEKQKQQEYENAVNTALTPAYTDLFRNAESYRGKYIKVTGKILQTDSTNSFCRVATKKTKYWNSAGYYVDTGRYSSDDVVYIENCNSTGGKLLEDDIITVIGVGGGTKTYTALMGNSVEIPLIMGKYFWMVQSRE